MKGGYSVNTKKDKKKYTNALIYAWMGYIQEFDFHWEVS